MLPIKIKNIAGSYFHDITFKGFKSAVTVLNHKKLRLTYYLSAKD